MAGYASKQVAELKRKFGARIETLETGFSTLSTQLQSVDNKTERQHNELHQLDKYSRIRTFCPPVSSPSTSLVYHKYKADK